MALYKSALPHHASKEEADEQEDDERTDDEMKCLADDKANQWCKPGED